MALALPRVRGSQRKNPHSPASWGLSRRLGVRVLLHRDLLTCRVLESMPRSALRHCYRSNSSRFPAALRETFSALTPGNDGSSRTSRCASGMTVPPKGHSAQQAASSNHTANQNSSSSSGLVGFKVRLNPSEIRFSHNYSGTCVLMFSSSSVTGDMDEVDAFRIRRPADDTVSLVSSAPDSLIVEGERSKPML